MIIGITGSFGTGKSTVGRMFRDLGAVVIDADMIAHRVLKPSTVAYELIVSSFGKSILSKNYKINRRKLGKIVFDNKKLLKRLTGIVHPRVIKEVKRKVNAADSRFTVIDAPLLIEVGLAGLVDVLIVVKTRRNTQIKRAMKKTGMSRSEVLERIKSQLPLSRKIKAADFVIDNEGPKAQTKKQVNNIWKQLTKGEG